MDKMTPIAEYLQSIRKRLEAATPGPWLQQSCGGYVISKISNFPAIASCPIEENEELIANAPTDLSKLTRMVEVAIMALEFTCSDKCARGINPCHARETLDQLEAICRE